MPPENLFEFMRDIEGNIAFKKYAVGSGSGYPDSYRFERILEDINKFQHSMEPTQAVSTGVAHDAINELIKKEEIEPSLLDFIRESVSTVKGTKPENTSYGRAIAQLVEESYSPYIKQMDLEGFKEYGNVWRKEIPRPKEASKGATSLSYGSFDERTKTRRFTYQDEYDETAKKWYRITPRAFFRNPSHEQFLLKSAYQTTTAGKSPPDTSFVPHGDVYKLVKELTHAIQYGPLNKKERRELRDRSHEERSLYGEKVYTTPGTVEYEAHNLIEPMLRKRFETLIDSLSAPISVESLFQNQ